MNPMKKTSSELEQRAASSNSLTPAQGNTQQGSVIQVGDEQIDLRGLSPEKRERLFELAAEKHIDGIAQAKTIINATGALSGKLQNTVEATEQAVGIGAHSTAELSHEDDYGQVHVKMGNTPEAERGEFSRSHRERHNATLYWVLGAVGLGLMALIGFLAAGV